MTETHHRLELIGTRGDTDELACPVCGRRILVTLQPYRKTVLNDGDNYIMHEFGKGGLDVAGVHVTEHDYRLDVFEEFLNDRD